jgi:hypothetical protein
MGRNGLIEDCEEVPEEEDGEKGTWIILLDMRGL